MKLLIVISRHKPVPAQLKYLGRVLGSYKIITLRRRYPTVEALLEEIEPLIYAFDDVYILPVLPLTFIMRLVEESRRSGYRFKVLYSKFEKLHNCGGKTCPDYDPETDSLVYTRGDPPFHRHYRFRHIVWLRGIQFDEARLEETVADQPRDADASPT